MPPETPPEVPAKSPGSLLADEMYGATPAEPDPPPIADPAPEPTAEPAAEPAGEDPPEPTGDPEPTGEPVEDPEGIEVSSIEELADHFELDPEWLETLTIQQKVNGEMIDVSLADALSTHRQVTAADTYLAEAKETAKGIKEQANQEKEHLAGSVATFAAMINALEVEIESDAGSINWQKLRDDDPAEYTAKREDMRDRREKIGKLRTEAVGAYNTAVNMIEQSNQQAMIDNLPVEHEVFNTRIPEWNDEKFAKKERTELVKYLTADGFSPEDIKAASFNGKVMAMAVKAKRYDDSKRKSNAAAKKVVKIPKILKPGSHEAPSTPANADDNDRVSILYGKA